MINGIGKIVIALVIMFVVVVLILTESVFIYTTIELISTDLSCFKFCRSFKDSDSNIGTLAVEVIALYDL